MARKPHPNPVADEDRELFREMVGEVRPVRQDQVVPERRQVPLTRQQQKDDADVMGELLAEISDADFLETGEHLAWCAPGVQKGLLRKLRTGRYAIQGEIDLHGHTVKEAHIQLSEFLATAHEQQRLCLRIVHGKSRRDTERGPRLKAAVNAWLQRDKRILAFCSAPQQDGGTGATYVLLRRRR